MLFIMLDDQFEKQYADTVRTWTMPSVTPTSGQRTTENPTTISISTSYSPQFTTCYLFLELHLWHMSHATSIQRVLVSVPFFPPFICFFFFEFECECICCSFHLNYPVADLLVTKWRCTILKQFEFTVQSTIKCEYECECSLSAPFEWSTIPSWVCVLGDVRAVRE